MLRGLFCVYTAFRNALYLGPKLLSKSRTVRNRYFRQTQIETVLTVVQSEKSQCVEKVSIGSTVTVMTFTKVPRMILSRGLKKTSEFVTASLSCPSYFMRKR